MSVISGTSINGYQQLGFLPTVVNGQIRISFPGKPIPPIDRVGYFYVFTIQSSTPFQGFVIDSGLLLIPGLAVNYGTQYFGGGFGLRVDVSWNRPNLSWLLTIT